MKDVLPPQGVIQIMSLRDYFAAHAIGHAMTRAVQFREKLGPSESLPNPAENGARMAYLIADAMIKERDK